MMAHGHKALQITEENPKKVSRVFFVLEVTARAAADLLGLQANTTTLFYRKIRGLLAE